MTRIKMCGFTRLDDARAAVAAGAHALGFVCWPRSPRYVSPERVADIVRALPPFVLTVGVFVNASPAEVSQMCAATGLAAVQLHGDEDPRAYERLGRPRFKAAGVGPGFDPAGLSGWPADVVPVLDAADPARRGGTGQAIDWAMAAAAQRVRPIVLAGGLTPETVGPAILAVRPAGVDVSSGIEREPGVKDAGLMRAFVEAVRKADEVHA